MKTRASIGGHPLHAILVAFPIGLWVFSLICDLIYQFGRHEIFWKYAAFYTMLGGLVGAVLAAIPGFVDFLELRTPITKRIATAHLTLNLIVVVLYAVNLGVRLSIYASDALAVGLSVLGVVMISISGWLGGELV